MTALILVDPAQRHAQDVSQAASFMMTTRNRVRFVDVRHLAETDFSDVIYFIIACTEGYTFGKSVNDAITRHTERGMKTLTLMDVARMRAFREHRVN